jgi:hypothetical protein
MGMAVFSLYGSSVEACQSSLERILEYPDVVIEGVVKGKERASFIPRIGEFRFVTLQY